VDQTVAQDLAQARGAAVIRAILAGVLGSLILWGTLYGVLLIGHGLGG
jgi:hypothetical protein